MKVILVVSYTKWMVMSPAHLFTVWQWCGRYNLHVTDSCLPYLPPCWDWRRMTSDDRRSWTRSVAWRSMRRSPSSCWEAGASTDTSPDVNISKRHTRRSQTTWLSRNRIVTLNALLHMFTATLLSRFCQLRVTSRFYHYSHVTSRFWHYSHVTSRLWRSLHVLK